MEIKPTKAIPVFKIALGIGAVLVVALLAGLFFWFDYHRSISFAEVAKDRATLIDGIESYWNISELENFLKKKSLVWEIKQGPRPGPEDKRPPFIVDTVVIKNYSHLGSQGELVIELFNNRLIGTKFFPKQIDAYLERLAKAENLDLAGKPQITVQKYTRVWVAELAQEKKKYVGWEDVRLNEEMEVWIKKYS